mmetsp:Transcript_137193/g.382674  ORF Transcript_137193/g.382674 Transcript_137193/m.382674 type:complete len:207 (+) Transcript_137193:812-1432(+)
METAVLWPGLLYVHAAGHDCQRDAGTPNNRGDVYPDEHRILPEPASCHLEREDDRARYERPKRQAPMHIVEEHSDRPPGRERVEAQQAEDEAVLRHDDAFVGQFPLHLWGTGKCGIRQLQIGLRLWALHAHSPHEDGGVHIHCQEQECDHAPQKPSKLRHRNRHRQYPGADHVGNDNARSQEHGVPGNIRSSPLCSVLHGSIWMLY